MTGDGRLAPLPYGGIADASAPKSEMKVGNPLTLGCGRRVGTYMTDSRSTGPYWADSASMPRFPHLDGDLTVDVLIVGGGLTGLTAAYLLARAGRSVAVLDRARFGSIDSGHTSAHLTAVTDLSLTVLEQRFGRDHAQAVWD